jgi:hypothetical protein
LWRAIPHRPTWQSAAPARFEGIHNPPQRSRPPIATGTHPTDVAHHWRPRRVRTGTHWRRVVALLPRGSPGGWQGAVRVPCRPRPPVHPRETSASPPRRPPTMRSPTTAPLAAWSPRTLRSRSQLPGSSRAARGIDSSDRRRDPASPAGCDRRRGTMSPRPRTLAKVHPDLMATWARKRLASGSRGTARARGP